MASEQQAPQDGEDPLAKTVFLDGEYRPFGELGAADARRLGEQLGSTGGWGPLSKAAGVAQAWNELAEAIEGGGAETVGELPAEQVLIFARRLWILPPRGGFL